MAFLRVACAPAKLHLCHCPLWSLLDGDFCQFLLLPCCLQLSRPPSALMDMAIPVWNGGRFAERGPAQELLGCPCFCHSSAALAAVASWSGTPRSYFTFFLNRLVRVCQILLHRIRYFFAFCFLLIRPVFTSFVSFVLSLDFWLENIGC